MIYSSDFLGSFNESSMRKSQRSVKRKFISIRYLMETRAKTKRFTKINPSESKIWKLIFKYSSKSSDRYLSPNDLVLNLGDYKLCVISIKAAHKIGT